MAATDSNSNAFPEKGLLLVGMGMGSLDGMTVEAQRAAKAADHRRYEAYTALWPDDELARLEEQVGSIQRVMRPEVEEPDELFTLAKNSLVALLVVGDPLQATTHVDLQLRAQDAGIDCRVIHGISITTVVTGAIGLSNYKFGRQTTLTYPYGDWIVTSPLEVMLNNQIQGLHTLVLFDLDPTGAGTGDQRPMQPKDAFVSIEKMAQKLIESDGNDALKEQANSLYESMCVLCSDLGTDDANMRTTTINNLGTLTGGRLNCMVFLANMSEMEQEAVNRWK